MLCKCKWVFICIWTPTFILQINICSFDLRVHNSESQMKKLTSIPLRPCEPLGAFWERGRKMFFARLSTSQWIGSRFNMWSLRGFERPLYKIKCLCTLYRRPIEHWELDWSLKKIFLAITKLFVRTLLSNGSLFFFCHRKKAMIAKNAPNFFRHVFGLMKRISTSRECSEDWIKILLGEYPGCHIRSIRWSNNKLITT